jgi:hypothetical protein
VLEFCAGVAEHLLPVVSNPAAQISPKSAIKGSSGKVPSVYNSSRLVVGFPGWTRHAATSDEIVKWSREPDYGICIQSRAVRGLDCDIDDASLASAVEQRIQAHLGVLPTRRRSNSSKFLSAFHLDGRFGKRVIETGRGRIEFLGDGQQFVAVGTHPSGVRYEWDGSLPGTFPVVDAATFEKMWADLDSEFANTPQPMAKHSPDRAGADDLDRAVTLAAVGEQTLRDLESALVHLDPTKYEVWIKAGQALKSLDGTDLGERAKAVWMAFGKRDHRFDIDQAEGKWSSFGSERTDFRAIFAAAQRAGWVNPGSTPKTALQPNGVVEPYRFRAWSECDTDPPTEWIIKGVLPKAELGMVYGESGSGKSFFVFDAAASVARGVPWRGRKVQKQRVIYICAEGAGGFRKRVKAYRRHHGVNDKDAVMILECAPNLLNDPKALIAAINKLGKFGLVVLDTFARTTPGADENSAKDMGKALDHCKAIHEATGALVLLVHHSGKDATKGARGWSGIKAACDFEIEITRVDDNRCAMVTKSKDGEDGAKFWFRLNKVHLGEDSDGEAITSCVVVEADAVRKSPAKGIWQIAVWQVLTDFAGLAGEGMARDALIENAAKSVEMKPDAKEDRRKEYARKGLDDLIHKGALAENNGLVLFA